MTTAVDYSIYLSLPTWKRCCEHHISGNATIGTQSSMGVVHPPLPAQLCRRLLHSHTKVCLIFVFRLFGPSKCSLVETVFVPVVLPVWCALSGVPRSPSVWIPHLLRPCLQRLSCALAAARAGHGIPYAVPTLTTVSSSWQYMVSHLSPPLRPPSAAVYRVLRTERGCLYPRLHLTVTVPSIYLGPAYPSCSTTTLRAHHAVPQVAD
jgi:hypothetical protein